MEKARTKKKKNDLRRLFMFSLSPFAIRHSPSASTPPELLEGVRRQRGHALHRPRIDHDFTDIEVAAVVGPDAVRRDEVAGQHRVLAADLRGDLAVGIAY